MQPLYIESSKHTPEIFVDLETGNIKIKGVSYPEDSTEVYQPVFDYVLANEKMITRIKCVLELEFLNSNSQKSIFNLLLIFQNFFDEGKNIEVLWMHDSNDEDMKEMGEDLKHLLYIPMEIIDKG